MSNFERINTGAPKSAPITNPILKYKSVPTRGNAIKAMCAHCMGCTKDHAEPGFREAIRDCTSPDCPLYAFRPYRNKARGES